MPGKSCITQLVEILERIGRELDRGKQIDVLYLDMSKAFDKVTHAELLHRLRQFGFGGNIQMVQILSLQQTSADNNLWNNNEISPSNIRSTPRVNSWAVTVPTLRRSSIESRAFFKHCHLW